MLIDKLSIIHKMLSDDAIRPDLRAKLLDDKYRVRRSLREAYMELFKIISS